MSLLPQQGNWREREISEPQLLLIERLKDQLILGKSDLLRIASLISKRFITSLDYLKQGEASELIEYLKEQLEP